METQKAIEAISTEEQRIMLGKTKVQFKELMLEILSGPRHHDECKTINAYFNQKGPYKDPTDCFEHLCDCGAMALLDLKERVERLL